MLIKICGITNVDDARAAFDLGADWIGLNLVAGPRKLALESALQIIDAIKDASRVVILVNATDGRLPERDLAALADRDVGRLQLYGKASAETLEQVERSGLKSIVVCSVKGISSVQAMTALLGRSPRAKPEFVLLDAHSDDKLGGTGQLAEWETIRVAKESGEMASWPAILLAGGLSVENVSDATRSINPAGVDVSSGVESSPGRKDHAKIRSFVNAVRSAAS